MLAYIPAPWIRHGISSGGLFNSNNTTGLFLVRWPLRKSCWKFHREPIPIRRLRKTPWWHCGIWMFVHVCTLPYSNVASCESLELNIGWSNGWIFQPATFDFQRGIWDMSPKRMGCDSLFHKLQHDVDIIGDLDMANLAAPTRNLEAQTDKKTGKAFLSRRCFLWYAHGVAWPCSPGLSIHLRPSICTCLRSLPSRAGMWSRCKRPFWPRVTRRWLLLVGRNSIVAWWTQLE